MGGVHTKGWHNTVFSPALGIFCSKAKTSLEIALCGAALPEVSMCEGLKKSGIL